MHLYFVNNTVLTLQFRADKSAHILTVEILKIEARSMISHRTDSYNICLVLACETNSLGHLLCLLLKICFYNFNKVSSYRKGLEKNVSYQAVKFFNILRIIRCDLTVLHL